MIVATVNEAAALIKCSRAVVQGFKDRTISREAFSMCDSWQSATSHWMGKTGNGKIDTREQRENSASNYCRCKARIFSTDSERTVDRTLQHMGYGNQCPVRAPFLSTDNKRKILQF